MNWKKNGGIEMNQQSKIYWDEYWGEREKPKSVSAWQFGAIPDELAQLVIEGKKTATCSGLIFYEKENEPLPTTKDYSIILNSKDQPLAIIKTTEVSIMPMNEVSEDFAVAEGEGTYEEWKEAHVNFFTRELKKINLEFSEEMLLVCERFKVVDVKEG